MKIITCKIYSGILALFILSACAQVGSIEGGPKDETPPRVAKNGFKPANESSLFQQNQIDIEFEEFIQLNNPQENILIIPSDVKIKASASKKTVSLYLDGTLKPNRTYTIYLNNAIKDYTEGNDSLMRYVFSTGEVIDSLTYTGFVKNAFDKKDEKNILVGLYQTDDTVGKTKPTYFVKTDAQGKFSFAKLQAGNYQLLAFEDGNKDLKWQVNERVAFTEKQIKLDTSFTDSTALRLYIPKPKARIRTAEYIAPNVIKIGTTQPIKNAKFTLNKQEIQELHRFQADSLWLLVPNAFPLEAKNELILESENFNDTIDVWIQERDKNRDITYFTSAKNGVLKPGQKLEIHFSALIKSIDKSALLFQVNDSTQIPVKEVQILSGNTLQIELDSHQAKAATYEIPSKALVFEAGKLKNDLKQTLQLRSEKEYGSVLLQVENDLDEDYFLELVNKGTVVRQITKKEITSGILLELLESGIYAVRAVLDKDGDGAWSTGNFSTGIQPEKMIFFNESIQVRNNWEIEVLLNFNEIQAP